MEAARLRGEPLPGWKRDFILKNAQFYERHADVLEQAKLKIDAFPPSRRKFEWQAGEHRPLAETIMHFRPSGIRCKKPDYVPALVAINQTSVLGDRRRLTPRETARLQGLPDSFEFRHGDALLEAGVPQKDAASYKQMGNGVNVGAAYYVFRRYVQSHATEIAGDCRFGMSGARIVAAIAESPDNPDVRLCSGVKG